MRFAVAFIYRSAPSLTVQPPPMVDEFPGFPPQPARAPTPRYPAKHVLNWAVAAVVAACVATFLLLLGMFLPGATPIPLLRQLLVAMGLWVLSIDLICVGIVVARGALLRPLLPHAIRQPMVPAGLKGPVPLSCPNCGAPPVNVDRFGGATCTYCATRFIFR